MKKYVPQRGDIVFLDFAPTKGHEQGGRRPALVVSPRAYNSKSGLMLACPITSKEKGYPFEVAVVIGDRSGVILVDQIRCIDWKARKAEEMDSLTKETLADVIEKLGLLVN